MKKIFMSRSTARLKIFPDCDPSCYGTHFKCARCNFAICDAEDVPWWRALNSEQIRRMVEATHRSLNDDTHNLVEVKRPR